MKKIRNILFALAAGLVLTGCSNDDFVASLSDEDYARQQEQELAKTQLVFSIGTGIDEVTSKASSTYRDWEKGDPTTFGVYGFCNRDMGERPTIFSNQEVTRDDSKTDFPWSVWKYDPLKYWADYTSYDTYDFFAYMPYMSEQSGDIDAENPQNGVLIEKTADDDGNDVFTLSFPVKLTDDDEAANGDGAISDVSKTPLICKEPAHKAVTGEVINLQMDQIFTSFYLEFKLHESMSYLRDFVIKKVEITGGTGKVPVAGVVQRSYTYKNNAWEAGDITWRDTLSASDVTHEVPYVNHDASYYMDAYQNEYMAAAEPEEDGVGALRIGYSNGAASLWGDKFYTIPVDGYAPTIEVTYDVQVMNEDGTYTTTRKDIVGKIELNSTNFSDYTVASAIGETHKITIIINPEHLYVLADADQRFGDVEIR